MVDRVVAYYEAKEERVAALVSPLEVERILKARTGEGLCVSGAAMSEDAVMQSLEAVLETSVRTQHPLFLNQLYGESSAVSVGGEAALAVLNTNAHTYEVAPALTLVERAVVERVGRLVGWERVDGLTTSGGSMSNLYALHLARHAADPEVAKRGASGRSAPSCAFVSEDAHYSFLKASRVMGLGDDNLVAVSTDRASGAVDVDSLEAAIEKSRAEGRVPFFVGTTAGTTVRGGFDDLGAVSEVCARHGLWHHCDAAWGGPALLSESLRAAMRGVEACDSVALNFHKLLNVALPCALFVTRHPRSFGVNATHAPYLFQDEKPFADLDPGDKSIQCGRKADALKIWLAWRAEGDRGLARTVDACVDLARRAADKVRTHPRLDLVFEPTFANVCFRPSPRQIAALDDPDARARAARRLPPLVKREMHARGCALIGVTTHRYAGDAPFFRLVVAHGNSLEFSDLERTLDLIADISEEPALLAEALSQ
ncbi:hypothetical protein CTAYLR_003271 [Chrysophaeum taylorii]|uniref:Glutamate decarboxylase n=1 Tax=Chrysophaeum taylorii TaxID=2483200 RepID=A0AAD7UB59_9STRA|nr:hypothetical protein CTAYLR_003271 [Chrysophaeum taylorii]